MKNLLITLAHSVEEYVISWRRRFHCQPELRWQENHTLTDIANELYLLSSRSSAEWHIYDNFKGGLACDIIIDSEFDTLLFRADVDALPISEDTGLEFTSIKTGVMHACGHDTHPAMLLGFAKALAESEGIEFKHNFRLVFQRAEENPGAPPQPMSGGNMLVRECVLDTVDKVYALHIKSDEPKGVFSSRNGALMGNSDRMGITIKATGGHVMEPHNGSNALLIANTVMSELNTFIQRELDPQEPATLVPTSCTAGKGQASSNIMPATADLWYGVRTMLNEQRQHEYHEKLALEIQNIVKRFPGASVEVNMVLGHPATINKGFTEVKALLESFDQKVQECPPCLGGEDFAYYLQQRPGCFVFLGADDGDHTHHHTPKFSPSEDVLWQGVLFWLALATN